MNNREFIAGLAEKMQLQPKEAQRVSNTLLDSLATLLEKGNEVSLSGFGTFEVKKKNDRTIVHPVSGQKMLVPPKLVLNFKQSPSFKAQVRGGNVLSDKA